MIDLGNPSTWCVLVLVVLTYAAQLALRFRWVPRTSTSAVTVAAVVAVAGAAIWPIWSTVADVFPGSLLNAAQDAIFGSSLGKLSIVLLYLVSFAGFYGYRPFQPDPR